MSSEQLEKFEQLGRRAVACKMWRWMPGMLAVHHQDYGNNGLDGRVIEIDDKEGPMWIGWGDLYLPLFEGSWPDLRDPATLGCLLALVREAHDNRELVTAKYHKLWGWTVCTHGYEHEILPLFNPDEESGIFCDSEAAALVEALEVAP